MEMELNSERLLGNQHLALPRGITSRGNKGEEEEELNNVVAL